jgi:hypothetical protein
MAGIDARLQRASEQARRGAEVDGRRACGVEVVEERRRVRLERSGGLEKIWCWVRGERARDVLRKGEGGKRADCGRAADLPRVRCVVNMRDKAWPNGRLRSAYLHGLDSIVCLVDGVDLEPLFGMREHELVDDLYLVF